MIDAAPCPFGLCDGCGFVVDEDTRVARPVPLPPGARRSAGARGGSARSSRASTAASRSTARR